MPQSPELAGGEGFTFEGDAAAYYLAALLAQAYAPGIDNRIVVGVSVQQRDFGEPLDDVIVDFEDSARCPARLSLQVKRTLTISKAKTNSDFREVIRDSWLTLKKPDLRIGIDRYGAAVGTISPDKERALKTICDWARESLTAEHFHTRFTKNGNASADNTTVKNDVATLLEEAKGSPCTDDEVHQFLAHFVLIQFDFLREGAIDPPEAVNRIRDCLAPAEADKASLVWSFTVQLARTSAGKSGQFDRTRLVREVSSVARLRGATSLRDDLDKLSMLANSYAALIPDDVGGTRLERMELTETLDTKLATSRIVQIRGLPGSGKSVVVRRAVQRALQNGSVLFLKAEQLEGTSWISYAAKHGLSSTPVEQLLVEIAATGTPILFIDAIDRIEKEHQGIILDLFGAIAPSPLLDQWRVVVSLRDTGIEVLRNWLGDYLEVLKVDTLDVGQLSDEEAEVLAHANPQLRPLLFGSARVQNIVRRPFFVKVLNQGYQADPSTTAFVPQSEIDLIDHWWQRGGYNEAGQSALERQRALHDLANIRARQLSLPIGLSQLTSVAHVDALRADGILQNARPGISVRFAHDIFFEWAFFHVLAARGSQWVEEIKACGEPPAIARVVELLSQWEYSCGADWPSHLAQTEDPTLRSQWLRAWLIGPVGIETFEADSERFIAAVFADDFRLFRKALVWFQAERTTPNPNILAGSLPREQRERFADLLGWPSDFGAWGRLIRLTIRHISNIPQRLYPEIVAVFEVWQNALAGIPNPTSRALLQQCSIWLAKLDAMSVADGPDENSAFWEKVPNQGDFRKSLARLLLKSSKAEPSFAADYLRRVTDSERLRDDAFSVITPYSYVLAESLPQSVVELSLASLREELPDEQVAREQQEFQAAAARRNAIRAKPEAERTSRDEMILSSGFSLRTIGDFSHHHWDNLAIHDDHQSFWPPSPLREPFHSLFQSSSSQALRLLRELCNHAMTAWRQLHIHSHDRGGTPLSLDLTFPWGKQSFWGTDREYLWFRSTWAPVAIGSGFMALDDWCFAELERGRPTDELIHEIVDGNECIAILGLASTLALHTQTISETTLPLVTSQRLLAADFNRMAQDLTPTASLVGFDYHTDKTHIEAIRAANARPVRKTQLSGIVPRFIFATGDIRDRAREAILNFKSNLPYQYEEQRSSPSEQERLMAQALEYAELADVKTYQAYRTEDSEQIAIVHVSPSASRPERIARFEEASTSLKQSSLWTWASKSFEEKSLGATYTIDDAIALAREADDIHLFEHLANGNDEDRLDMRRGAVAATAAIVLNYREGRSEEELGWARDVLARAIRLPEKSDPIWSPSAVIPWHPGIYVARGLSADFRHGRVSNSMIRNLLGLIAHPLEVVSLAAIEEACSLWGKDPKLTWAALILAFSLCQVQPRPHDQRRQHGSTLHSSDEAQAHIDSAFAFYQTEITWPPLPLPPPAWVKIESGNNRHGQEHEGYDVEDGSNINETWGEPDVFWHSKYAAEVLKRLPFNEMLNSSMRGATLDFLASVLDWTNQKNAPPGVKTGRRQRTAPGNYEWTHALGSRLGCVAGLLPLSDFQTRLLEPILQLDGDACWSLLAPFTRTYVAAYIYDAPIVPTDAVATLGLCLERLLQAPIFKHGTYRHGELSGFDQPALVRTLLFDSDYAGLATRYANGNWSDISRILPLVDRFVLAAGWAASVMDPFLTLCERAKDHYPAEAFADQINAIVSDGSDGLTGWKGTFIPARIAALVQLFAHRDAPMSPSLAQKFLRILDILVDMGDRRSAALQLGEAFREIRHL